MYEIAIYRSTSLIGIVRGEDCKAAWKAAVRLVRAMCHADGVTGPLDGWYRTANRVGYNAGIFCATDRFAQPRDKKAQPPLLRVSCPLRS